MKSLLLIVVLIGLTQLANCGPLRFESERHSLNRDNEGVAGEGPPTEAPTETPTAATFATTVVTEAVTQPTTQVTQSTTPPAPPTRSTARPPTVTPLELVPLPPGLPLPNLGATVVRSAQDLLGQVIRIAISKLAS